MTVKTAVSAGGIILREIDGSLKIALAHHMASEKEWVLPKGHVERGETVEQAALREISEEAGLDNVVFIKHLGTLLRQSLKDDVEIDKTIHYFLAYALDDHTKPQKPSDDRFAEVGWFSPEQALVLIPYEAERVFLKEQLGALFGWSGQG